MNYKIHHVEENETVMSCIKKPDMSRMRKIKGMLEINHVTRK